MVTCKRKLPKGVLSLFFLLYTIPTKLIDCCVNQRRSCLNPVRYIIDSFLSNGVKLQYMNKTDLESLSSIRLVEAKCLFANGLYHGAYYLCGYAVECSLKACIAKSFLMHEFPNKKVVNESYSHDLAQLLRIANLHQALNNAFQADPDLEIYWSTVKDWSEQYRYDNAISDTMAADLITAADDQNSGVLKWLRTHW